VIDDGVDIDHVEFSGSGKVVAPRDVTLRSDDPRPKDPGAPEVPDDHGTACAGVACANGIDGASGVAPAARLMPIRLASGLGSQREADAFVWAADHGADVISCSWGPPDGKWWRPADPLHKRRWPLPASTRLAIDYVVNQGRAGRGCVILFAAGNGNEPTENDGYISYEKVIAVAACNDRGKRSVYSDYGAAVWCAFPSNDFGHKPLKHPDPLTPGIWTTDRRGAAGYNAGAEADGDAAGMYVNSFGGTSSACPGAAGVAALVLAANATLKWHEVKDLLRRACDRIDPGDGEYDAAGHSPKYGYGRLNARTAVELARPQPRNEVTVARRFDAPLPDLQTAEFSLDVPEAAPVQAVSVGVEIRHSYIGDLQVSLHPPPATRVGAIMLHDRAGGSRDDLKKIYDATGAARLGALAGRSCAGRWTLRVRDCEAEDAGTLVSFSVRLSFAQGEATPAPAPKRRRRARRQ
jgi:subtilisin family serine protease